MSNQNKSFSMLPFSNPPERLPTRNENNPSPFAPVEGAMAAGATASGSDTNETTRPLSLDLLLRFKKTIIVVALLVSLPVIVLIWALVVPEYRVNAQVRVRPIIPRLVFATEDNGVIPLYQSYLNTQVSVILSPTVLQRVLDQTEIQKTKWYMKEGSFFQARQSPLDRLRKDLDVVPRGMTEVIDIGLVDPDGREAAALINAILDQYLKFIRESSNQTDDLMYQKLMEEYNSLRNEIEGQEAVTAKLRRELGTGNPEELLTQRRVRIDEMEAQWLTLHRQVTGNEWQEKDLDALAKKIASRKTSPTTQETTLLYEDDTDWRRLYLEFRNIQHQVDAEKQRLGDSHPSMIEMTKRLKLAEDLLKERQVQLDSQMKTRSGAAMGGVQTQMTIVREIEAIRQETRKLKVQENLLMEDLQRLRKEYSRSFETAQALAKENEIIAGKRELYEAVRKRLDQKEMERNVPGSIEVLARAIVPQLPFRDRRGLFTLLALFGGMGVGLGVALLRASVSQMIIRPADIPQPIHGPFLGQLPLVRGSLESLENAAIQSEYVRMIRTALLRRLEENRGQTIMVTSASPRAGKTTVSLLLAKSLTQCGKRILLVDTDLHNPNLSSRFNLESEPGLLALLTNRASDPEVIMPTDMPNLKVLPTGQGWNLECQELLANGVFARCLERWRKAYDIVLLDAPPMLPVADAQIISRHMDGAIMVIREGHCRRIDITEALAYLGTSGGKLMGTIFIGSMRNDVYRSGYYGNGSASGRLLPVNEKKASASDE